MNGSVVHTMLPLNCNPNSRYKARTYYLRHIKKTLPLVEYNDLETEIERAGL